MLLSGRWQPIASLCIACFSMVTEALRMGSESRHHLEVQKGLLSQLSSEKSGLINQVLKRIMLTLENSDFQMRHHVTGFLLLF